MWRNWSTCTLLVGMLNGSASVQNSMAVPKNQDLPYHSAIPLLGIYPKELNAEDQADICTPLFTAALFTIVKR